MVGVVDDVDVHVDAAIDVGVSVVVVRLHNIRL